MQSKSESILNVQSTIASVMSRMKRNIMLIRHAASHPQGMQGAKVVVEVAQPPKDRRRHPWTALHAAPHPTTGTLGANVQTPSVVSAGSAQRLHVARPPRRSVAVVTEDSPQVPRTWIAERRQKSCSQQPASARRLSRYHLRSR